MSTEGQKPLVLVVDDQSANLQLLAQMVQDAGFDVLTAGSGEQALTSAEARKPDLVLLDMLMSPMPGVEVCRKLHQMPGLSDIPVMFVTGLTDRDSLGQAFEAGGVDYVTKPFMPEELMARVRTHVDLKRARDHLSAMVREREDVTNIVAHDLKNPLTCILFAAQLMGRPSGDAKRREELLREITESAEEALGFIQRFLARGAEGTRLRQFASQTTDLMILAREALDLQQPAAEVRGITLKLSGDPAAVRADAVATRNVLQNLISNAIKYSPGGQTVEVSVAPARSGFTQCLVLDRGPGIAPEDQKKLFQRFMRLATAKSAAETYSSGLGLAIAKHDVTQMGGYLWYEPRAGGGSVFGFELPRADAPAPATAPSELAASV